MNSPIEPRSDVRVAARELREIYIALIQEGFAPHEALVIIGQMMAVNAKRDPE